MSSLLDTDLYKVRAHRARSSVLESSRELCQGEGRGGQGRRARPDDPTDGLLPTLELQLGPGHDGSRGAQEGRFFRMRRQAT